MATSSLGSDIFAILSLLIISVLVLLLLRHYLPLRTTPGYLLVPVFLALALPCSIILLVPIDLASTENADSEGPKRGIWLPERAVFVAWRITYWLTFVLTWFILPLMGEYCDSGFRDPKDRMVHSLRSNARYQLIVLGTSIAGLVYFILQNGFHGESIKGQKSNRECVWNPNDYAGFHFKSENAFAQGKARRPRGSQANKPISLDVTKQSPQLAITVPVAEHALQYWASSYLSRAEDLIEAAHEWQAHVIPYWTTAKPGSCLHLAVSTLSQATFSRAHNIPHALAKADKSYLQCLARTQQAVCGQANETMDALLLTTIMMGYFENIRYSVDASKTAVRQDDAVGSRFTNVFCHYEGAVGLMKVRHERADKSNLTLDRVVRRQIVSSKQ